MAEMISGYKEFVDYFRGLAEAHTTIADFVVGGSERILNRELSRITYPVMWLEHPDISPYYKGGANARFIGAFAILYNAPADDWEKEEADLDASLAICFSIINKMVEDAEEGRFHLDMDDIEINHKGRWSGDNDWGWRVGFAIGGYIDCLGEGEFDDE